jgi:hypothetical protein
VQTNQCVEFRAANFITASLRIVNTQQFHRNLVAFNYLGVDFCWLLGCSLAIRVIEIDVKQAKFLTEKQEDLWKSEKNLLKNLLHTFVRIVLIRLYHTGTRLLDERHYHIKFRVTKWNITNAQYLLISRLPFKVVHQTPHCVTDYFASIILRSLK